MDNQPIRTAGDQSAMLQEFLALKAANPVLGTPEGDQLGALMLLVQAYEACHFSVKPPEAAVPLVVRNGVVLLPMRPDAKAATLARVNQLRDEFP